MSEHRCQTLLRAKRQEALRSINPDCRTATGNPTVSQEELIQTDLSGQVDVALRSSELWTD